MNDPLNEGIDEIRNEPNQTMRVINGVSVPSDFPQVSVDNFHETAPGRLFLANEGGTPIL